VIDELRRELAAVGIRGARRDRILAEFADHLACNPRAELGEPRALAAQFADDLAGDSARHTAFAAFGALAAVAAAVALPQLTLPTVPDITGGRSAFLVIPATLALVVGAQVAFAAGCLAVIRALRFGGVREVALVRRRTAVALGGGAVTVAGSALYVLNFSDDVPRWWAVLAVGAAGIAAVALGVAVVLLARSRGLVVSRTEAARGLSADLGPLARPALLGTAAACAMFAATALFEQSVVEGLLRGAFEAVAFTLCFTALRRPLALSG
jgi:hypothetical protein